MSDRDREPPYLKVTPDESDEWVPHRDGNMRKTNSRPGRLVLRTPYHVDASELTDIAEAIRNQGVSIHGNHDTSHPFYDSRLNVYSVGEDNVEDAATAVERLGCSWQRVGVAEFHLLPIPTIGQLVVKRPPCGCKLTESRCNHDTGTGGEVDDLLEPTVEV